MAEFPTSKPAEPFRLTRSIGAIASWGFRVHKHEKALRKGDRKNTCYSGVFHSGGVSGVLLLWDTSYKIKAYVAINGQQGEILAL